VSYQTLDDEILSFTVVRDSVLISHPGNRERILVSSGSHDPWIVEPSERLHLRGRGVLEISGAGQRFRVDEARGFKYGGAQ
jgi:hypothetical protein